MDNDGVPDYLQDHDCDGIPDGVDPDDDNDGYYDLKQDSDNDGILNEWDDDDDNDGIPGKGRTKCLHAYILVQPFTECRCIVNCRLCYYLVHYLSKTCCNTGYDPLQSPL